MVFAATHWLYYLCVIGDSVVLIDDSVVCCQYIHIGSQIY